MFVPSVQTPQDTQHHKPLLILSLNLKCQSESNWAFKPTIDANLEAKLGLLYDAEFHHLFKTDFNLDFIPTLILGFIFFNPMFATKFL